MIEEQRHTALLNRLKEMDVQVYKPICSLTWQDIDRIRVKMECVVKAADLP
jgi:hypothetical protein